MSLSTHSKWFYGHEITASNLYLPFNEGASELTAELTVGSYTITEFCTEIGRAMTAAGGQTYTASLNRSTRKITISASSTFSLLTTSGLTVGTDCFSLAGFSGADKTGTNTYTAGSASGSEYATQFICQDYVSSADYTGAADAVVNRSASGKVEVVKFGTESFFELSLKYITNNTVDGNIIRNDATGYEKLQTFMNALTTKNRLEFMPNEDSPSTFYSVILEKTPESDKGVAFKLKEMYGRGLPGFYETGILKFRVVD